MNMCQRCKGFHKPSLPCSLEVESFKQIPLSMGLFALVDVEDYDWLMKFNWSVSFGSHSGVKPYARTIIDGKNVKMHRLIMKPAKGMIVDHLKDNSLDNRRSELEVVTYSQNTKRHYERNPRKKVSK